MDLRGDFTQNLRSNRTPLHPVWTAALSLVYLLYLQGFHGIEDDVFLSLPCVLGCHGVMYVIKQTLEENEVKKLQSCARTMHEIQKMLKF